ncbi:MAG: sialidase [Caulobacteraceae bacterium]|nr:sialidase [Caulobacteraceae bacterium]
MSDRLFAATRKGLFEFRPQGGRAWAVARTSFLGSPVSMVLADPRDGALYAALDLGHFGCKLHRSEDGGATWSETAAPSYAGVEADADDPPSLKLIWALEAGGADEPGVLWAGTIPGGLFRSEDRGDSWSLVRGLWDDPRRKDWFGGGYDSPGIHSILVDPRDSRRIALGISTGGVWESQDGGASWTLGGQGLRAAYTPPDQAYDPIRQDVHRLARCAAEPDSLWIQHHNGVFRATGGIGRWEEIEPPVSAFGFAVAVHPQKPGTAWFAPAVKDEYRYPVDGRLVVNRTTDGGATFETLSQGLPQADAYDLVYRHGLDVDPSGERLAMGSTTGGLWFSEDGGDRWSGVQARLPPIYAVRFA